MDYEGILRFSFSWLFNRETLKYAAIKWAVAAVFFLLWAASFFALFGPVFSQFLADPINFFQNLALNPAGFLVVMLPAMLVFSVLSAVLFFAEFLIGFYISALFHFYGFRSANISYANFPVSRVLKLFVLWAASMFLTWFSWVHRKAWLLFLLPLAAIVLFPLVALNPFLVVVPILLVSVFLLALVAIPVYIYLNPNAPGFIVTNRTFMLVQACFTALILLSIIFPLFLLLLFLVFFAFLFVFAYNLVKVAFAMLVFLRGNTGILGSLQESIGLSAGKTSDVLLAFLIGGIAGMLVFLLAGAIVQAIIFLIVMPFIPDSLWGFGGLLDTLRAMQPEDAVFLSSFFLKQQTASTIASSVWQIVAAPLYLLFGVFLTIGIYLQLVPQEANPAKK